MKHSSEKSIFQMNDRCMLYANTVCHWNGWGCSDITWLLIPGLALAWKWPGSMLCVKYVYVNTRHCVFLTQGKSIGNSVLSIMSTHWSSAKNYNRHCMTFIKAQSQEYQTVWNIFWYLHKATTATDGYSKHSGKKEWRMLHPIQIIYITNRALFYLTAM